MANVKLSELTAASAAAAANEFEINEAGTSKKVTGTQISTFVRGNIVTADLSDTSVTAAELSIMEGVTATTAELNILEGVTATTAELNILEGVNSTTAQLNHLDGVTSNIQTQFTNTNLGSAKAWCCWNGTGTAAIRDSHGVSGLVDNDVGDYTFSYTSNFVDGDYQIGGNFAHSSAVTNYVYSVQPRENSVVTASSARLITVYSSSTASGLLDYPYAAFNAHGKLA